MQPPKGKGLDGLRALGETVSAVAAPMLGRRGFAGTRVVAEWPSIVGDQLAGRSLPERVVRAPGGRGGGTLHVRISSGSLALELQHLEPLIVERINTYFGYQAVTGLKMLMGHSRTHGRPSAMRSGARRRGDGRALGGGDRGLPIAAGPP